MQAGSEKRGRLFVVAAPSGAGKTSLVRALMAREPSLTFSVSFTTRPRRPSEIDGRDYHFIDEQRFGQMLREDAFVEHARVFGHQYGTGRAQVARALAAGQDLILEIDWQGARQVRERVSESVDIFILPPSRAVLEQRLRDRRTDSPEVIERRLRESVEEMSHWAEFRYVVVNDDFAQALEALTAIVHGQGEALRSDRPGLGAFAAGLLG
ncbi:MAG: guanylate kinase [Proteobacteria bacterium]|nr:guanylate kinase [Pseudomonadota bacterium]